jgi:hypothetical protein
MVVSPTKNSIKTTKTNDDKKPDALLTTDTLNLSTCAELKKTPLFVMQCAPMKNLPILYQSCIQLIPVPMKPFFKKLMEMNHLF